MSRFAKYLGDIELKVGDEKIIVRPTLRHKQKLLGLHQSGKSLTEADWSTQYALFKEILKTTEPDATDEELEGFLVKHDMDFMMELFVGFGWANPDDIKGIRGSVQEELKKRLVEKGEKS